MKKKVGFFLLAITLQFATAQEYRYTTTQFDNVTKTADVVYGNAPFINAPFHSESTTTDTDLVMDVYTPTADTHTLRPAIIFAHSGAFLNGDRSHEDMVAFADSLARKGYITASIDYRKGFYPISNVGMHGIRAVYRSIQDGRAAVRYLRANADTYGIDPDKVYLAGSSAGAFIALHAAYMNDPEEKPEETDEVSYVNLIPPFVHFGPDLGAVDVGDHLSENGQPDAIIALWGAIQSQDLITIEDTTPIFMAHGTADSTIPFESGFPFGYPLFPEVDGSQLINEQLETLEFTNKDTYFVEGEPHEFYGTDNGNWPDEPNAHWPIMLDKVSSFLWLQHKPTAQFTAETLPEFTVDFTDTSAGALSWLWDFGDGSMSAVQHPSHTYEAEGEYIVTLYIENDILSWDEIAIPVTAVAEVLDVSSLSKIPFTIYPNPTENILNISSEVFIDQIMIYNALGEKLYTTTENQIDISHLAAGVYMLNVRNAHGSGFQRFIKR